MTKNDPQADKHKKPAAKAVATPASVGEPVGPSLAAQEGRISSVRRNRGLLLLKAVRNLMTAEVAELLAKDDAILMQHEGTDVNVQDENGMTALHHAAALGARPCIRLLVGSGQCDYLIRDNQGRYAFEIAIEWARDYAVGRLLAKKQAQQAAAQGVTAYEPHA